MIEVILYRVPDPVVGSGYKPKCQNTEKPWFHGAAALTPSISGESQPPMT
jgi:hypothetical protein